jgi:FkbM family methyltransferase
MLLSLTTLIKKYSLRITGVIHVGAHHGEEVSEYFSLGIKNIALIEPCAKAFNVLKQKFGAHHHIKLFNYACAPYNGEATMFTETANKGQSNSLLQPIEHLKHYPEIKFTGSELVKIRRLDALKLDSKYNMINMDVQGAEGGVIIGATETLRHIDYIYTEVNANDANLYQGAIKISELDQLLKDFERVETSWTGQGWGDGLYIKRAKLQ